MSDYHGCQRLQFQTLFVIVLLYLQYCCDKLDSILFLIGFLEFSSGRSFLCLYIWVFSSVLPLICLVLLS